MKIISWNCNGKFREKYKEIKKYDADIYVIQECENPQTTSNADYKNFASNCIWVGKNNNKGLGIFAKATIKLKDNKWKSYCLKYFVSVRVNNKFNLLGVWACDPYIEEYYIYQNIHFSKYNKDMVIIGDFNSNAKWDNEHKERSHGKVLNELKQKKLVSAYHSVYLESQGFETENTFYLYRHLNRGYHIDHCFAAKDKIKKYEILDKNEWLSMSDHIPLLLEIDD